MRLRVLVAGLFLFGVACGNGTPKAPVGGTVVSFGDEAVRVEIADEAAELRRGLMFRESLEADAGMLFVMPRRSTGGFWMKNTLIPLSIAFLERTGDSTFEVVDILDMEPCRQKTCPLYRPRASYDVALEVNEGWFRQAGVEVGDTTQVDLPTASPAQT